MIVSFSLDRVSYQIFRINFGYASCCNTLDHVFKQAFWRKNPAILTTENIIDIPPEYLDTDELVSDMRSEYASKLEQVCYFLAC